MSDGMSDVKAGGHEDCWQCREQAEKGDHGHFHCDRCGASILNGEDPWYREGDEVICNRCKVEESYG